MSERDDKERNVKAGIVSRAARHEVESTLDLPRLLAKLGLSLAIAGVFLWLAVRSMLVDAAAVVEGGAAAAIWESVRSVPLRSLIAYTMMFGAVHIARTMRWVYQVRPLGADDGWQVFRITLVGFAAILALPLRLGEIVRPYLLSRETSVRFSEAVGTTVVERVIDGLFITALLFLSIAVAGGDASPVVQNAGRISAAIFVSASLALVAFAFRPSLVMAIVDGTVGRASPKLAGWATGLLDGFVEGVRTLRRGGALIPYLALTLAYWGINAAGLWYFASAFGFELPLHAGFGLLAVLVVGIMIPAGPGYLGNFQLFLGEGLKLYLPASAIGPAGLAFGLVLNVLQFVIQVGCAVPLLISGPLRDELAGLRRGAGEGEPDEVEQSVTD